MGRIKNAQIDMESDLYNDLSSLHEQLTEKKEELINFRISCCLEDIRVRLDFLTKRLDDLERKAEQKNIKMTITEKSPRIFSSNPKTLSLLSVITAITAIYYGLRR